MAKIKTGIVNVTGYAGMELARLLDGHEEVELASVTGRSASGQKLGHYMPHLDNSNLTITQTLDDVDLAFLALPHRESASEAIKLYQKGTRIIDISADFRLKDPALYPEWYGFEHPCIDMLAKAVYGLPELYREQISGSSLIANPGCYPTAAILALMPALKKGLIKNDIIIDAKSGISGAGRSLSLKSHFCEANEDITAYATEGHRHLPEIIQELKKAEPAQDLCITFNPYLVPVTRGILASCYAGLKTSLTKRDLFEVYSSFYRDEPFIRVTDMPPHTKQAAGSNYCLVCPTIDKRTNRLVVISAIDNLIKGAAGQAVQNMNLMLGFNEKAGLEASPLFP